MSMKKFELEKIRGLKVTGQMKAAGIPSRFAEGAGEVLDKRERRLRDAALGLVPFACKLPSELARRLNERAVSHEGGMNALLAEFLTQALDGAEPAKPKAAAKKAAAKEVPAAEKEAAAPAAKKKAVSRKP